MSHLPESAFRRLLLPESDPRANDYGGARDYGDARNYGCGDDNVPGGRDTVGHSSVQGWSAGDLFPAVIAVVETYAAPDETHRFTRTEPLGARLRYRAYDLTLYGRTERFSAYDDAAAAACAALAAPAAWLAEE